MKSPMQYILPKPSGPNVRNIKGYQFEWTDAHIGPERLDELRQTYDTLSDDVLDALSPHRNGRDIFSTLEDQLKDEKCPEVVQKFWNEVNSLPPDTDWAAIDRGQQVFYRYGGACITGLAFQSLLGGMGMYKIVETLSRTGGFSEAVARKRMLETTQHILQCTKSLDSIKPGGDGWKSSVKVRLLHASVRQRILRLEKDRPGYYDVKEFGVPVNDLDSIGTIISFSAFLIWISLPAQGLFMLQSEIDDYMALWRLIAHYLGTPLFAFSDSVTTKAYMESIIADGVAPSPTSQLLAQNIIAALSNKPPTNTSPEFLTAQARWLSGDELCDALGLMSVGVGVKSLVFAQCVFFCVTGYAARYWPRYDKWRIQRMRNVFWKTLIESKFGLGKETNFDMQYLPGYDTKTYRGKPVPGSHLALKKSGPERKNLIILLIVLAVFALLLALIVILLRGIIGVSGSVAVLAWEGGIRMDDLIRAHCSVLFP